MRFSPAFLLALCAFPVLICAASAQTTAPQGLRSTQLFAPSQSSWGRPLSPAQMRAREQRSLQARDRAFEWLDEQAGPVEAPNLALLSGRGDLESWTWNRYRAVTGDETLTRRQREAMIAGVVHQDLQLAEAGLGGSDQGVRRRALRVASIATLYSGMLGSDPRLQSALYEGFLLPNLELAPSRGWSGADSMLEGASAAFRSSGRVQERREVLLTLLERQTAAGNAAGADMTRVHLADAFAAEGYYQNAIEMLLRVQTPDLQGARAMLSELRGGLTESLQVNREIWENARQAVMDARLGTVGEIGGGTAGGAAPTEAGASTGTSTSTGANTDTGAGVAGGGTAGGEAGLPAEGATAGATDGALAVGGVAAVIAGNGRRLTQTPRATGNGPGAGDGPGAVREGESQQMRRVRLAAEAARRAQELSKDAQEKATIALALLLEAADAQAALEAAEAGRAPAASNRARPGGATNSAAPPVSLLSLRQNAQRLALRASEAAGEAKRAAGAAQKASEEAALLALRVFLVEEDAPQAGEATAPTTPAPATSEVPVAREAPRQVQPAPPVVEQPQAQPQPQTEAPTQ